MTCDICLKQGNIRIATYDLYGIHFCWNCHSFFLHPKKNTDIGDDYAINYDFESYSKQMRVFRTKQYLADIQNIIPYVRGRNLLDIGCAAGWFLKIAKKFKFKLNGTEPQKSLANFARESNSTAHIYKYKSDNIDKLKEHYDLITLWSVLEHLENLNSSLTNIAKIGSKHCVIVLRTPYCLGVLTIASLVVYYISFKKIKIPLEGAFQLKMNSKHWYLFSKKGLKILLKRHGFKIVKLYTSPNFDLDGIDLWFKARKSKPPWLLNKILCLILGVAEKVEKIFDFQDDIVVIASQI